MKSRFVKNESRHTYLEIQYMSLLNLAVSHIMILKLNIVVNNGPVQEKCYMLSGHAILCCQDAEIGKGMEKILPSIF
jgi:hypothetical protein